MTNCQYCGKEDVASQHMSLCGKNPNRVGINKGEKQKRHNDLPAVVTPEVAVLLPGPETVDEVDEVDEEEKIPEKEVKRSHNKKKVKKEKADEEEQEEQEKADEEQEEQGINPIIILILLVGGIILAGLMFVFGLGRRES